MAKSKVKKGSQNQSEPKSKRSIVEGSTKASLPAFNETALSALTEKLEKQLTKPGTEKKSKDKGKKGRDAAKPQEIDIKPRGAISRTVIPSKGKKRARNGDVLTAPPKEKQSISKGKKVDGDSNGLKQEVYALGGTDEDLELIGSLDTDSEMLEEEPHQSNSKGIVNEKSLQNGIKEMIKDINLQEALNESTTKDESIDSEETESLPDVDPRSLHKPAKVTPATSVANKGFLWEKKTTKLRGNLTVEPRPDWFAAELSQAPNPPTKLSYSPKNLAERIHSYAKTLLEAENQAYAATTAKGSSSQKFYNTIMSSGTLTDRISALTLLAQESPLHNMKALGNLVGLARKRSRAQAVDVLRALKDLFAQGSLLPSDRKLKHFQNQPSLLAAFHDSDQNWVPGNRLPSNLENKHLVIWAFEHWLKELFFEILKLLEIWCNDEIEFARARAVSYVWELLKEKPEQESNLLRLLVNKLGDPNKKIASRASYLLLQLESAHPMMKGTIISAVESEFLFKPGQSQHAKYYGIITLNQTALTGKDGDVANKLLDMYFSLFVTILKPEGKQSQLCKDRPQKSFAKGKKDRGEKESDLHAADHDTALREKIISAILTGVNRAYPYSSASSERLSKHIDALFRITHSSNFNTSIQALMLIQQLSSTHQVSSDRYYRTLYESLLDLRLIASSKQSLYLNLLYRSLKQDVSIKRVKAFIKRIVQILNLHQPSFVFGAFHLIKELEQTFPSVKGLMDEAEDVDSDEEEVFRDVPEGNQEDGHQPQQQEKNLSGPATQYDSRKRDPEHSNADRSCLWELSPFLAHFHPSVAVSSLHLLRHEPMEGKPDLSLHTLIHFLDRFVYRNPKAAASALRGNSVMQPLAGSERGDLLVTARPTTRLQAPVNDESFWKKQAGDVAAEDAFFHEYFYRMGKAKGPSRRDKGNARRTQDSETDEEEESEIWKALVRSKGDVDPDEDGDVDLDMDDMESDEDVDDEEAIEGDLDADDGVDEEDMPDADDLGLEDSDDPWAESDEDLLSDIEAASGDIIDAGEATAGSSRESQKKKRRKLKQLPTFASAEDYAAMIDDDHGEDMG